MSSFYTVDQILIFSGNTRNIGLCDVKMLLTTVILSLPEASTGLYYLKIFLSNFPPSQSEHT